jgi:hypothetical protein
VIPDNRPQLKISVTEEIVNRDTSPPRQVIKSDGVYVEGVIQGMKITFTADTGAARTVVSAKNFHKIPLSQKPTLQMYNILASANGQSLTELGKGVLLTSTKFISLVTRSGTKLLISIFSRPNR